MLLIERAIGRCAERRKDRRFQKELLGQLKSFFVVTGENGDVLNPARLVGRTTSLLTKDYNKPVPVLILYPQSAGEPDVKKESGWLQASYGETTYDLFIKRKQLQFYKDVDIFGLSLKKIVGRQPGDYIKIYGMEIMDGKNHQEIQRGGFKLRAVVVLVGCQAHLKCRPDDQYHGLAIVEAEYKQDASGLPWQGIGALGG